MQTRPWRQPLILATAIALSVPVPTCAAGIVATVTDENGKPLENAVVAVAPEPGTPAPTQPSSSLAQATIDQRDEMFVPEVVVIHAGGGVIFRNSDHTHHHVYSFARIKQFEFVEKPGDISAPVQFDVPGWAAIGCNIHDNMIAYVYVTTAPWAAVTDANGRAAIDGLPAGNFVATVWHPRLRPNANPPTKPVTLASQETTLAVTIPVQPPRRPRNRDSMY